MRGGCCRAPRPSVPADASSKPVEGGATASHQSGAPEATPSSKLYRAFLSPARTLGVPACSPWMLGHCRACCPDPLGESVWANSPEATNHHQPSKPSSTAH